MMRAPRPRVTKLNAQLMSTSRRFCVARCVAACRPPKPPPTTITRCGIGGTPWSVDALATRLGCGTGDDVSGAGDGEPRGAEVRQALPVRITGLRVARIAVERVAVVDHLRRAVGPRRRRELGGAEPRPRHGPALRADGRPRGGAGGGAGALAAGTLAEQVHGAPARVDEHLAEAAGGLEPDGCGSAAPGLRWRRCVAPAATRGDGQGGERHAGGRGHDASGRTERVHRPDADGAAAAIETTLRSVDMGARSLCLAGGAMAPVAAVDLW